MFYFDNFYGKKILKSTLLKDFDCFFTTRDFVLTPKDLIELNEEANKNIKLLKSKFRVENIITANQIHGDNIEIVIKDKFFYDNTDAIISDIENSVLILNFADCVPIILYSPKDNTGALVHAGWRGSALNIAKKTVEKMEKELNINPYDITALIGPSIGKCCFETNEDVFNQLITDKSQNDLYEKKDGKYFIDLKLLNYNRLVETGIEKIDLCSYCTFCMSDIFFSYRKEKGKTARHSAIIKIRGKEQCQ